MTAVVHLAPLAPLAICTLFFFFLRILSSLEIQVLPGKSSGLWEAAACLGHIRLVQILTIYSVWEVPILLRKTVSFLQRKHQWTPHWCWRILRSVRFRKCRESCCLPCKGRQSTLKGKEDKPGRNAEMRVGKKRLCSALQLPLTLSMASFLVPPAGP